MPIDILHVHITHRQYYRTILFFPTFYLYVQLIINEIIINQHNVCIIHIRRSDQISLWEIIPRKFVAKNSYSICILISMKIPI